MGFRPHYFPNIQDRYITDILGLFHHYHHRRNSHEVHHCDHTVSGVKIEHCSCEVNGLVQHAINQRRIECMVHLPDITGIKAMSLYLSEGCPVLGTGWYHLGSLETKVMRIYDVKKISGRIDAS